MRRKPPPQKVEDFKFVPADVRNPLVRFIGSLSLGLSLLFVVIIATSVGELSENEWALKFIFTTWWYRLLLAALGVNLLVNTYITYVEDTYPQFLPIFRSKGDGFRPLKIKHKARVKSEGEAAPPEGLIQTLASAFHARGYRCYFDGRSLYGHRGLIARFGSTVTHMGLITIVIGALVESFLKIEGQVTLIEGQKTEHMLVRASPYKVPFSGGAPIMPMGVTISLHDFEFTKYPGAEIQADGGVPSKFKSTVTLEGASDRPLHDYVRVNHRIKYGGWIFHQEAYSLPNEESPDPLARELAKLDRFFIEVAERLPDGRTRAYQLENYIHPTGRTVAPLPGRDDRFLSLERSPSGEHALWTVASNEKVLARGSASLFGDLQIRMIAFLPDFAQNVNGIPYSKSDRFDNPAAFVAIASDNRVIFQEWVIANAPKPEPHLDPDGTMHEGSHDPFELALVDYELTPEIGGATGVNVPGARINGDAHDEEKSIGERVVATIALRGGGREQRFKLIQGRSIPVVGGLDSAYEIAGPFELAKLRPVPAMATILSVSKNPGVPICWAGAVMASFGPFLAFFVSRRRVWATIEENGQVWFGGESRYSRENLEDEITQVVRGWESERRIKLSPEIDLASEREREKLSRHL